VTGSLCAQVSDSPGSVNCPPAVNLTVTVTTEGGAVIPHAFVILREDTLGQPRGVKVFELELRTDETGKATAAVPCNYLDVFVAHDGFAPAAQKILITIDKRAFSIPLKWYPITRTTEVLVSGGVPTVTAELPSIINESGHGSSEAIDTLWHWFDTCSDERKMGVEVLLDGKAIYHSSFPVCPISDLGKTKERPQKVMAFSFRGGHTFQGEYHTVRSQKIAGNIWQAGTDPGVILLGFSFSTKEQVLLNTVHIARPGIGSKSEIDHGLVVRTFPLAR